MLANHDASVAQFELASSAHESRTAERQKHAEQQRAQSAGAAPKRTGMPGKWDELLDDPKKGSKLEAKVAEARPAG